MPEPRLEDIRIIVEEKHGIRRFLYPIRCQLPPLEMDGKTLIDDSGHPIPCELHEVDIDNCEPAWCLFAVSLAPFEKKVISLSKGDTAPAEVHDPLKLDHHGDSTLLHQNRIAYGLNKENELCSVVYDGVEHLAGPLKVNWDKPQKRQVCPPYISSTGLWAACGVNTYPAAYEFTSCKSFVTLRYQIHLFHLLEGAKISYKQPRFAHELPLTISDLQQTCDFGLGNGTYARLKRGEIDEVSAVVVPIDDSNYEYKITSLLADAKEPREDYSGIISTREELLRSLWFHWIEPSKSLAVAITKYPFHMKRLTMKMNSLGVVSVILDFDELPKRWPKDPTIEITYHFLNAIPPIAAATNPASIICKPEVRVEYANQG